MDEETPRFRDVFRHGFLTGLAVIVPLLITLIVLAIAFNYVYDYLDLFSDVAIPFSPRVVVPYYGVLDREVLVEIASPIVVVVVILCVGMLANSSRYRQRAVDYFDCVIEQIPDVGSVYENFRQTSDVMLESDSQNFQEVVLVEFPTKEAYSIAFVTSETPESVTDPVGRGEMTTLFMPMAPNPVMGGHVVFVPNDRIVEVDVSVEEGIRALVTSGVAIGTAAEDDAGLSREQLRRLTSLDRTESRLGAERGVEDVGRHPGSDPEPRGRDDVEADGDDVEADGGDTEADGDDMETDVEIEIDRERGDQ